jgi:hypothetical protein
MQCSAVPLQGQLHESQKEKRKRKREKGKKKRPKKAGLKVAWPGGQQWGDLQENNNSQSITDCASGDHVMNLVNLITIWHSYTYK